MIFQFKFPVVNTWKYLSLYDPEELSSQDALTKQAQDETAQAVQSKARELMRNKLPAQLRTVKTSSKKKDILNKPLFEGGKGSRECLGFFPHPELQLWIFKEKRQLYFK